MLVLHDPLTLAHRTIEFANGRLREALESPERVESILRSLETSSHDVRVLHSSKCKADLPEHFLKILDATHDQGYLDHLDTVHSTWVAAGAIEQHESILPECFTFPPGIHSNTPNPTSPPRDMFARAGYYAFDMSSGIMSATHPAALASAHLAFTGAQLLLPSSESNPRLHSIFALCRPPGHHCPTNLAGGFCYLNNAVIAAATVHSNTPNTKIGVLDIDFHHGNGTQSYFYARRDVFYVSIHGQDEFPYYTGAADEIGTGAGQGFNLNLPLKTGSSVEAYLEKLELALTRLDEYKTDFLIVSLGFDTFCLDVLGNFKIDTDDYRTIAGRIRNRLKDAPALILLEGGYVVDRLGENVLSFLTGWEGSTQ